MNVLGVPVHPVVVVEETGEVYYALQEKQYEAYQLTPLVTDADQPYPEWIGYGGAAGGGKSYLTRAIAVAVAFKWPGSTSIIFRRTEREVIENHVNKLRVELPDHFADGARVYSWNGQEMCATFFNGSRIYFGYLKSNADFMRYQGQEYDFMGFEESTHYMWRWVSWLMGNRSRATVAGSRPFGFFPSNPGGIGHAWYKRLFISRLYHEENDEQAEDFAFVQARLRDNRILMARDPRYERRLNRLPEPYRSWQRDGDFSQGAGAALPELQRDKHLIPPFKPMPHWFYFASFDWGFKHPWSFGVYAADEDGTVYKLETITGMLQQPAQIAERIIKQTPIPIERIAKMVAGHDLWAKRRAYGEVGKTLYDRFADLGLVFLQADIDRVQGLESLRTATSWKTQGIDEDGQVGPGEPGFLLFDTPGNRKCYQQLEDMTPDPENEEDVIKVHADDRGEGGDDIYDETRYALHTWPVLAESRPNFETTAWDPSTLLRESEEQRRVHTRDEVPDAGFPDYLTYGEFGARL
jgi:phage terminase large subunit